MKNFFKSLKNKALALSAAFTAAVMGNTMVNALASTGATGDYKTPVWTAIEGIMEPILWFVAVAGALMVGWGVVQLIMGFKEEDAEKKNRGTWQLIIGLVLVMLRIFLMPILRQLLGM